MSVYRELASELRANKAVIDSLNSRNQQLLQQNQFLKQEIHNVVQSALSLGQAAGVAKPAFHLGDQGAEPIGGMPYGSPGFPNAIAPDTLAKLAQAEANPNPPAGAYGSPTEQSSGYATEPARSELDHHIQRQSSPTSDAATSRVPKPITPATQKAANRQTAHKPTSAKAAKPRADKPAARQKQSAARTQLAQTGSRRTESVAVKKPLSAPPKPKLFTEQSGSFRSSALDSQENKEISGIWLVLSIILIVVTAFGAGFLIMKPLLNDR